MGERLIVRWRWTFEAVSVTTRIGLPGVALGGFAFALDGTAQVAAGGIAMLMVGSMLWALRGGALVLDDEGIRSRPSPRGTPTRWDEVVAAQWSSELTARSPHPALRIVGRDGRAGPEITPSFAARRITLVNEWLRTHQPDIRIDPTPPWRDRFGQWHVAEPGYDPFETMMSVRRSLVGPWEITARSCDGGFRAQQRMARNGALLEERPVRPTLAEAKNDGIQLVRAALDAARSTHE